MKGFKLLFFFLLLAPLSAMAQVGLYTEFSTTHIQAVNEPRLYGVTLGGYKDKKLGSHLKFLTLGPDFRLSMQSGTSNSGIYSGGPAQSLISVLLGPRLAFKLPIPVLPLRPYVEGLIGGADSQIGELLPDGTIPPGASRTYNKNGGGTLEGHLLGGVDLKVFSHVDWRVVEFSYGQLFLATGGTPNLGLISLSTGIVVRLP